MRRERSTFEERVEAVKEYLSGQGSQKNLAEKYGVSKAIIRDWIRLYESFGTEGLEYSARQKCYSKELKTAAVSDYLKGKGSQAEICKKYKIRSSKQLRNWIQQYNSYRELRSGSGKRSAIYMAKGRKTTKEERIEIGSYCIENGIDYAKTMEKYGVSYQ